MEKTWMVMRMSNLGLFASRFELNIKTLNKYNAALAKLRKGSESEKEDAIDILRNIFEPIVVKINGDISSSILISEGEVTDILRQRYLSCWPTYKQKVVMINLKLQDNKTVFSQEEYAILEDVADAIDAECEQLFRRMSERR